MENVYELDGNQTICNFDLYKDGLLYGIDFGSLAVLEILNVQKGENFLDLCCAPGAKLANVCDKIEQQSNSKNSIIVGNDISKDRLNVTQSLINKYGFKEKIKLINIDGI